MKPNELYHLTPNEFHNLIQAANEKRKDRYEEYAVQALFYRIATTKKRINGIEDIYNREKHGKKVVDIDKKRKERKEIQDIFPSTLQRKGG